jgi:serine/threonine protein kinase/tetratricopeptide (TPR) repeat protein
MSGPDWIRIEQLFEQAADLPSDQQRALVDRECGGDPATRDAVLSLLEHDRARGGRVAAVIDAAAQLPALDEPRAAGTRFGPYRVVGELGRGGMGVVFDAVRDDGAFTKRVALKVAAFAAWSPEFQHRFRDERQILARLEHPHIARLLDGGTSDDGVPYFAMEFVEGEPITTYVAARRLPVAARLRLFLQVCEAVEYAHQNLVIHRDLKPGNILVAGDSVKLLDFGISKLMEPGDAGATATGLLPFTPAYCSPEQLYGAPVTTRTDVHALGLVLFEILTGVKAQPVDTTTPVALERAVVHTPVPRPSAILQDAGDPAGARRLRGDLDTIVHTAADRAPGRRYQSVAALADDVRRHLASQPLVARQASRWYRTTRFARRHWRPLAAAALLLAALAAGIVATRAQAARAERRFQEVRRIANALMGDVYTAIRDLPASTKAQEVVVNTAVEYLEGLARESGDDRNLLVEVAQGYTKVGQLAFSLSRPSLGRADDARRYLARARELLEPLQAAHPDDPRVATAMVALHTANGNYLHELGQNVDAMEALDQAIQVGEAAMARHPDDVDLLGQVLNAYDNLTAGFESSPAAMRNLPRYLERAEQFAARRPGDAEAQSALGVAYSQAGKVEHSAEHVDAAIRYFRRNGEIQAGIVAAAPYNITARRNLMLAWSTLNDVALGPLGQSSYTGPSGPAVDLDPQRRAEALDAALKTIEQAAWIHEQDPQSDTGQLDLAVAEGRSAPGYPPGDDRAIAALERSIVRLHGIEPRNPARAQTFLIEMYGTLAERQRQAGRLDRAREAWRQADAMYQRAVATMPGNFYPRRLMIPVLENQALTLARAGDTTAARAAARRVVAVADEVGAAAKVYARAPGWPPRVRDWHARLLDELGDTAGARAARLESTAMWTAVATRTDLPADVVSEAKAALQTPSAR